MPVRLRGHHFLCILTYRGFGYTPAFVDNMSRIVAEISVGRPVQLISGSDDICGGFTAECRAISDHDCTKAETLDMDRAAIEAIVSLLPELESEMPLILDAERISSLREAFADGSIRSACARCSWNEFCTAIAAENFSATRLFGSR